MGMELCKRSFCEHVRLGSNPRSFSSRWPCERHLAKLLRTDLQVPTTVPVAALPQLEQLTI